MRYRIKQWFAVLLALMMTLTTLPVTALAESVAPTEETNVEQVQSLIDELPEAEEITAENRTDVQAQIDAIDAAMLELTEDQAAALDTARYDAAVAALLALDDPTVDNGMEANIDPDPEPSTPEQVQALIDALPDAEEITAETRDNVQAQIEAIDAAMLDLAEDETAALDTARYDAAAAALLALGAPSILEQVQSLIDALPEADSITDDNRENVELQLSAIDEKKLSLTDGERAMLDVTRYNAAVAAILALDGQASADVPMPIAEVAGFECEASGTTLTLTGEGKLDLKNKSLPWDKGLFNTVIINGATSIADSCFKDWTNLQSVTLPNGLTSIGASAFAGCESLSSVSLPEGLTTIGDSAFSNCKKLTMWSLPAGLESIEWNAFYNCESLCLTELPAGITAIGVYAFYGCKNLALASLPAGITGIENYAFYNCRKMTLTELPKGITHIGSYAFNKCNGLKLTELPEGVTTIGDFAFSECNGLTQLTMPASLTSMGEYVFFLSYSPTTLIFSGKTAPSINGLTFSYALALREIFIPEGAVNYDAEHGWPMDEVKVGRTVTVNSASGGSASAAPTYAGAGDTIVLTATPDEGYHLKEWKLEPETEVTDNSFLMPDADVTVTPVFEPHDFSGAWQTSNEKHWRECSCGERRDEGAHTYTNGVCSACGYSFECDIFVKTLSGDHTELHVNSTDTVRSVKEKIKENEGIPVSLQVLKLPTSSAELENDKCLADCGVIKDSTLHLTLRYAPGGTGAEDSPYLISDKEQLEAFRYYINSMSKDGGTGQYFKLTADIDLENEPWSPIGTGYGYPFAGTFDGGDHTIRGLYIEGTSGLKNEYLGFFRVIGAGGTVKDLTVAGSVTGGIVGENETTVEGCSNAGLVTGDCVGGIVGTDLEGTIKNCSNAGPVEGNFASGIVNDLNGTVVENCSNTGTVTGNSASGIAGLTIGTIKNCYNTGAVTASGEAAGVVQYNYASTVENCYNTGAVTGKTAGGVVSSNEEAVIKNCYNTGAVSGSEEAAGVVRYNYDSTVENCYNTGAVTGETTGGVVITNEAAVIENCYYLDACGGAGEGTPKTADQFASGEVAYLLQGGQDTSDPQVWGQTVGKGTPELTDSADKTVYKVTFATADKKEYDAKYANYNGRVELPKEPAFDGKQFDHWATVQSAGGGEKFDSNTAVTGDITVYAVGRETFGGESGEIAFTATYGEGLTKDLSGYVAYKLGTGTAEKFKYKILSGNSDDLGAAINGDRLNIPNTAKAGSYTLTIEAEETEPRYSLMSVLTYGVDPVRLTVKVIINKADPVVKTPPVAAAGLLYTGEAQALVTKGTATGGTMQYSLEQNGSYSTDIPTGVEAGEYTVWYKVVGDENHNDSEPRLTVKVIINKADPVVKTPPVAAAGLLYTGEAQALVTAGTAAGGEMQYSLEQNGNYSTDIPTGVEAGEYTVWYKVVGDENHNDSEPLSVFVIIGKIDGTGSLTMADFTCKETGVGPEATSDTNGPSVTFTYAERGTENFTEQKPDTAGFYTVKAVFPANQNYKELTLTADFKITHLFNAGWEHREDGYYQLCACGVGLLLETKELTEVPEGLKGDPAVDTVEEIERVLAEKVAAGDHYVIYDVELEAWIGDEWQIITPDRLPDEGVAVTIPYPEGTNARYPFTVVHMFTTAGDGHAPGDTEVLETTNGPDGIHFTVKSFSPIAIGWKTGNMTVTVTDTGEGAGPAQQWQFRVELDDKTITGTFGEMEFTAGVAEFTLASDQSLTASDLPEGLAYTVTELNENQNGYTTTYTDDSGFITSEQDMIAAFVNDKPAPAKPDTPSDDPDNPPDKPTDNKPGDNPNTGDESHLALWFSLMILSLIGITVIVLTPIMGKKKLVSANGRHVRR